MDWLAATLAVAMRPPMAYRSFKRILGETNLERKCLFLFGTACWW